MTFPSLRLLLATALLATACFSLDAQAKPKSAPAATREPAPAHRAKATAKAALVDINRATKEELKSLPGIQDPQADRIIAGRPYLSKARLVTRKILNIEQYNAIKKRIIARQ
ncbi:MAG: helix-hairpin-helix domain-containing protein [Holophagaceae bacterium]|nr:helix-hairpin-helix domain-containing protein [Holophagaceae bacterium]